MRFSEPASYEMSEGRDISREWHVNAPPTYAEDNTIMNRLRLDQISKAELRKLYRIAQDGLKVRSGVELELAKIKRQEAVKIADKSIDNGLKHSEIFRMVTELLKGLRP